MESALLGIGLIIGCFLCYFVLRPKIKTTNRVDEDVKRQNEELSAQLKKLNASKTQLCAEVASAQTKREELEKHIKELRQKAEEDAQTLYQKDIEIMREKLKNEENKYQGYKDEYQKEYLLMLEELVKEYAEVQSQKAQELAEVQKELDALRDKATAAIEAAKRDEDKQKNPEDYCIHLDKLDKIDIARMIEFSETLNNPRALLMCIWTSFIRTPLRTLCNKIFGNEEVCGIYRLTINGQIYIGQSVHCKERITEHFKKALGIDAPTTSKLYSYLHEHNIWDIQVELLETCAPEDLNDREKFFIELLSADKSLNSTVGNKG